MTTRALTEALHETLAVFEEAAPGTPLTTSEVADALDVGRRSTYDRLQRLVDRGRLETKEVGARGRVWWQPRTQTPTEPAGDAGAESPAAYESLVIDVAESVDVGMFVLDDEFRVAWTNRTARRYFGLGDEPVLGRDKRRLVEDVVADAVEDSERFAETVLATYDDNTSGEEFECRVTAGEDREARWLEHRSQPIETGQYAGGRVEFYYDVSDRRRMEQAARREREQFDSMIDAVEEYAILMLDADGRVETWNVGAERIKGYAAADVVGEHVAQFYTEEARADGRPAADLATAAEEGSVEVEGWRVRSDGSRFWAHVTITAIRDEAGDLEGFATVTRDMTDRREYERRLERERDELAGELDDVLDRVDDGFYALDEEWQFTYVNDQAEHLLGLAESSVLGRDIRETLPLTDEFEAALVEAFEHQEPVVLEDYYEPIEEWFENSVYPSSTGLSVYFRNVTERKERERQLEYQREQLATLNDLNRVVRDITEAVVEQPTRVEVGRTVCEAFARADPYEFAWLAEVDPATQRIKRRVEAGVEGYVEHVEFPTTPGDPFGRSPLGHAVRRKEPYAVENVFEDPVFEPWREAAREFGYRAVIAVPVLHEETVYGVLAVYADRDGAFVGEERHMLAQVGEVAGHAISAIERKRALMSDEVVELEFRAADIFELLDVETPDHGRITFEQSVPTSDGDYLVYGSTRPDGVDALETLTEVLSHWGPLSYLDEGDAVRFQVRFSEPPAISLVAAQGGRAEEAVIEDGDFRLTFHVAPGVDVRQVTDAVQDIYPAADLVSRQQISRPDDTPDQLRRLLREELTARQRATLEAAYYGGLFAWPRESSGEELAEAMDVSGATFHQHLRKAQQKVLRAVLTRPAD